MSLSKAERHRVANAKWRSKNIEKNKIMQVSWRLRSRYGLTPEQWTNLLAQQGNVCAICGLYMEKPRVDHNHITGKIHGLLHANCNAGIGMLRDSPTLLRKAAEYLENQ